MEAFSEPILLSDAIVVQYARIHDIGPCWSKSWECKYKVNVDILYRYQLRLQMRFQFFNTAGRQVYDLWSNVYYVPILEEE